MENITNFANIDTIKIDTKHYSIFFTTQTFLKIDDILRINYDEKFYFFKVTEIITEMDNKLSITATETGFQQLHKSSIDLRELLHLSIDLIQESEMIKNVRQQATWC